MIFVAHKRKGTITEWVGESDCITHRTQYDLCPYCNTVMIWEQYCDVWTEDDNGLMQPDWDGSEAWHADCAECDLCFVDPYSDGLLRAYRLSADEDV